MHQVYPPQAVSMNYADVIRLKNALRSGRVPMRRPLGDVTADSITSTLKNPVWIALSTASMAACAYHGYRRNNSVGWALWWGLMGSMFPVIAPTIALAEGFGKPARK